MLRDLLASLSLANLCFLGVWIELSGANLYYFKTPPSGMVLVAAVLCVLLLGVLMWIGVTLFRSSGSKCFRTLAEFAFLLFLLIPLNVAQTSVAEFAHVTNAFTTSTGKLLAGIIALAIAIFAFRRRDVLLRIVAGSLLFLSPLALLTIGQAIWTYARRPPDNAFASLSAGVLNTDRHRTRILWLLFDEWDYRLAFEERPSGLMLPEMDRLRTQSFSATHAVAADMESGMPCLRS